MVDTRAALSSAREPRILLLALLPIGDTLFTTPTIRALRLRYPHALITAITHAGTAPLLRCVPALDDVVVLPFGADWAGIGPLARTLRLLHARHYDAAVDFTTPAYKWISFACGIPKRTYMKFDPFWWLIPDAHRRWRSTHATRHYYDCARELDLPPWPTIDHRPYLRLPTTARAEARLFLAQQGVTAGQHPLIGIHPGSSGLDGLKSWPPARFAELAVRLHERWQARILLLGGPNERKLSNTVAAAMHSRPIIATGTQPLMTSIALIEACNLFIGDDSGPLHAAAAVGTPYIGIFGPTCPANFRPIAAHARQGDLARPAVPCRAPQYFVGGNPVWQRPCCREVCDALTTITVDDVFARVEPLLQQHSLPADECSTPVPVQVQAQAQGQVGAGHARDHARFG